MYDKTNEYGRFVVKTYYINNHIKIAHVII